jgi:hypothetical protein
MEKKGTLTAVKGKTIVCIGSVIGEESEINTLFSFISLIKSQKIRPHFVMIGLTTVSKYLPKIQTKVKEEKEIKVIFEVGLLKTLKTRPGPFSCYQLLLPHFKKMDLYNDHVIFADGNHIFHSDRVKVFKMAMNANPKYPYVSWNNYTHSSSMKPPGGGEIDKLITEGKVSIAGGTITFSDKSDEHWSLCVKLLVLTTFLENIDIKALPEGNCGLIFKSCVLKTTEEIPEIVTDKKLWGYFTKDKSQSISEKEENLFDLKSIANKIKTALESAHECDNCKTTKLNCKRCTGCKKVYYCHKDCQKAAYKNHKSKCVIDLSKQPIPEIKNLKDAIQE